MLNIFKGLENLLKVNQVQIDGCVFRLHCNVTVVILIAFSLVVTTKQYVGNPIECVHSQDIPEAVMNTFCWIHSTFTVLSAYNSSLEIGVHIPHPGIAKTTDKSDMRLHRYYQWVCFVLFFQAVFFYIPCWLWKTWEGGKISYLTTGFQVLCTDVEKKDRKKLLLEYLRSNLRNHDFWFARYLVCELLSFANVVGQIYLLDRFFDGEFLMYGLKVLEFLNDVEDKVNPMLFVFPKMTKCNFYKFGSSGSIESHDALCLLPLNEVNEKFYIFLWFWFFILSGLSAFLFVYRLLVLLVPQLRAFLLRARLRFVSKKMLKIVLDRTSVGDWYLFYMLGKNMDCFVLCDVLTDLIGSMDQSSSEESV